jgi:hypothetical protein
VRHTLAKLGIPVRASRAGPHQITHRFVGRVSDPDRRQLGGQNRRLAKDFENLAETQATFVTSIQLALRPPART